MRKQLTVEDFAMLFHWTVALLLTPFVLLPLFPREPVGFWVRFSMVAAGYAYSIVMTGVYLRVRSSRRAGAAVVNITATLDVALVFSALLIWPKYLPDRFWVFPLLVMVVAARFGYLETAAVALALSALYAVSMLARLEPGVPTRTVVGDTMVRIVFLMTLGMAATYITRREKRQGMEARVLSRVASAVTSLEAARVLQAAAEGVSEATGGGRAHAYTISRDRRWLVFGSSAGGEPGEGCNLTRGRIDLRLESPLGRAVDEGLPLVVEGREIAAMQEAGWVGESSSPVLVVPLVMSDGAAGVVTVEKAGIGRRFDEREVEVCAAIAAQASTGLENALRYAEERRKRSEADVHYRVSRELSSSLDMDRVLENACRIAIQVCGAAACTAYLLDPAVGKLKPVVRLTAGGERRRSFPEEDALSAGDMENMFNLAQRPPALILSNPGKSSALPPTLRGEGVLAIAPFLTGGRINGLLCVSDSPGKEFLPARVSELATVSAETSLAVMNARLHERIKLDAAHMASLVQLANAVGTTADLDTIMRLALETVRHMFECSSGLIYRVEEESGNLICMSSFGYPAHVLETISTPPYRKAEECWAVAEERPICLDDLSSSRLECSTLARIGTGSTICVAMQAEGRVLGVLHVRSEKKGAFGEEDQQMALAIADQVGLALQRAALFEEISRLAETDPLTGVYNVRRLSEELKEEVNRADRYGRPLSFLMVDVDNLKSYNDTLGHQSGDAVLVQVASLIDGCTREVDKVFRYGGDEFCVMLPETGASEALVVAEKIRKAVEGFSFDGEDLLGGEGITVSLGVATFPADSKDADGLVRSADLALYRAKQRGRNSVSSG